VFLIRESWKADAALEIMRNLRTSENIEFQKKISKGSYYKASQL